MKLPAFQPDKQDSCLDMIVCGERLTCDWSGCLYWASQSMLIVSDLHLEKGSSFAKKGNMLPPYDSSLTLMRLANRIARWQPKTLIALGDSFHDQTANERLTDSNLQVLFGMMKDRNWIWISGNHDPVLPESLGGTSAAKVCVGPLTFRHEPQAGLIKGEIAGHLHPSAKVNWRANKVRRPCFISDGSRLIMPAFGSYTGGLNIRHKAFDGLFNEDKKSAILLGKKRVYHISSRNLMA